MSTVEVRALPAPVLDAIAAAVHGAHAEDEIVRRLEGRLDPETLAACRPAEDGNGLLVLRGLPVDAREIGPTPSHWSDRRHPTPSWDAALLALAALLGRPFGWEGQQAGRIVHDIVPSRGHELEQTGASSTVTLSPHTEDAFHPGRANLLVLGCVRNPDAVATTAASVRDARLSARDRERLCHPELPILPDDSYAEAQGSGAAPPTVATLWEIDGRLGLRYDPAYTPLHDATTAFREAYARLGAALDEATVAVTLAPGDVLVVDNDLVVHGRVPFRARYDGTDRWLKRVSVRVEDAVRPADEADEHGYGQRLLDPFADVVAVGA